MSTSDEERSLSGGSSVSGRSYGSVPAADISLGVDDTPGRGDGGTAMTPITAEDERHARRLRKRLALDGGAETASGAVPTFVKLDSPDEVAVIVPHGLHFNDVEHIDYTALADRDAGLAVQSSSADTQAAESPMHAGSPMRLNKSSLLGAVVGNKGKKDAGARNEGDRRGGTSNRAHPAVLWFAIMLTGLGTGLVSVVLTNISVGFGNTRLQQANELLELNRPLAAGAVWVLVSAAFTFVAAAITVYYAPQAAATGIPETKAFLNGCDVRGAFSLQTFCVKSIGVCMVIAAGAPVGLEGPMIHIGAMVASYVTLALEHVGLLRGSSRSHLLTHLVTCGVSSGISAAFNSPIGGVLFVLEDLAARWLVDGQLILQCFVSSFFSQLVVAGAHITSLLVQTVRSGDRGEFQATNLVKTSQGAGEVTGAWYVADVGLCVLLGVGIGALLSFSTAAATTIVRVKRSVVLSMTQTYDKRKGGRKNRAPSRISEVVAAVFPVVFVSVIAFVAPLLFSCKVRQDHVEGKSSADMPLGIGHQVDHRMFVRFTCQQGQYNDLASLLLPSLSGSYHSTLTHLYSRDADEGAYSDASLVVLAACYYIFPLFIIGCSFPFGLFVPNMVFGSAAGHLFGRMVNRAPWLVGTRVAHPTVYAVLGAGAALGGWTRMAIAISAIMLEQTGNTDSLILMMVAVLSSRLVGAVLTPNSFTDEVIKQKNYEVLEPREPKIMSTLSAGAVCARDVVCLRPVEDAATIVRVLMHTTHTAFPVCQPANGSSNDKFYDPERRSSNQDPVWRVETGSHEPEPEILGLVTRATLLDLLEEMVNSRRSSERSAPHLRVPASVMDQHVNFLGTGMMIGADELGTVPAHVPASRVYRMFSLMGVRRVIVVQSGGGNRLGGVITRRDLLNAIEEEEDLGDGGAEREMRRRRARGGGSGPRQRRRPATDDAQGGGLLTTRPRASWASGWEDSRTGRSLPATVEH